MIELELLGIEPNGERLSFNDSKGNRYCVPITDELRAALRTDIPRPPAEPAPISPRKIQALFRAGKSVDDVAQMCPMPASQLLALEYPIAAERRYTAAQARAYRQAHELGGLTIDELITSRLIERGVSSTGISWDAYREDGAPWTLTATYTIDSTEHCAMWRINTKAQAIIALNDEAAWLTETQVPAPSSPWRALNTPQIDPGAVREAQISRSDSACAKAPSKVSEYASPSPSENDSIDIDSMLASLDTQRGTARPLPDDDFLDDEDIDADGISTLDLADADDDSADESEAPSAVLLAFPTRANTSNAIEEVSAADCKTTDYENSAGSKKASNLQKKTGNKRELKQSEPSQTELPMFAEESATKKEKEGKKTSESAASAPSKNASKSRRSRPTMPSWDEIVFGYSKDSDA